MSEGRRRGLSLTKQTDFVLHAGSAQFGDLDTGIDNFRKIQFLAKLAFRFDNNTDDRRRRRIQPALRDQMTGHGCIEIRIGAVPDN